MLIIRQSSEELISQNDTADDDLNHNNEIDIIEQIPKEKETEKNDVIELNNEKKVKSAQNDNNNNYNEQKIKND